MATKKQYVNGIASKANILMAARICFAQRGFFETSMTDIEKAAKTTRGVLYHHFASKDEMILAITAENLGAAAQKIEADLQQLQATGKGELNQLLTNMIDVVEKNYLWTRQSHEHSCLVACSFETPHPRDNGGFF
jgi:TetR/AcrR family acrAB operon transcriptional repressor